LDGHVRLHTISERTIHYVTSQGQQCDHYTIHLYMAHVNIDMSSNWQIVKIIRYRERPYIEDGILSAM